MSYVYRIKHSASEDRLEKLIEERLKKGANKAEIDSRIWDLFGEEWAILYTDLSGFSRNVEAFGIVHFMQIIHESKKLLTPIVDQYDGILLKMEGDSMLTLFKNPKKAVDCAVAMQREMKSYNVDKPETEKVLLCVGIGFGKILRIGDDDVFGEEVNSACKLGEDTAKAWEIMITEPVYNLLDKSKHYSFELMTGKTFSGKNTYKLVYSL